MLQDCEGKYAVLLKPLVSTYFITMYHNQFITYLTFIFFNNQTSLFVRYLKINHPKINAISNEAIIPQLKMSWRTVNNRVDCGAFK